MSDQFWEGKGGHAVLEKCGASRMAGLDAQAARSWCTWWAMVKSFAFTLNETRSLWTIWNREAAFMFRAVPVAVVCRADGKQECVKRES